MLNYPSCSWFHILGPSSMEYCNSLLSPRIFSIFTYQAVVVSQPLPSFLMQFFHKKYVLADSAQGHDLNV